MSLLLSHRRTQGLLVTLCSAIAACGGGDRSASRARPDFAQAFVQATVAPKQQRSVRTRFAGSATKTVANTGISLEIMAHEWSVTQPIGFSPGHAFMCIAIRLQTGIKEDCYGFFKVQGEGGRGLISGPGVKLDQMNDPKAIPARFGRVTVSTKFDITEQQRRAILKAAEDWSARHYHLTKENCIDFVAQAARIAAPSRVPARGELDTPERWVRRLLDAGYIAGTWKGTASANAGRYAGPTVPMELSARTENGVWTGSATLADQIATYENFRVDGRSISFTVGEAENIWRFTGTVSADGTSLTGSFSNVDASGTFSLIRQAG